MANRIYEHPNGYTAVLYGKSSMSINDPDGNEVLHTGFRTPNTKEEVMDVLEGMPEFMSKFIEIYEDEEENTI